MNYAVALVLLLLIAGITRALPFFKHAGGDTTTYSLGFLLLTAYIFSRISLKFKLPRMSGYILAGLVLGPFVAGFFSKTSFENIYFINHMALAFIAFSAGGELKLEKIRARFKYISAISVLSILVIFFGVALSVYFLSPLIPFLKNSPGPVLIASAALFGVISCARSPSSVIAIISETRARGPLSETVLSVTIVLDVVIIILFAFVVSFCNTVTAPGASMDVPFLFFLVFETLVAIGIGIVMGLLMAFLTKYIHADLPVVIVLLGVFVTRAASLLSVFLKDAYDVSIHLEPLLICMAAGFSVVNFSGQGKHFLESMERVSLPIYALFFAVAGASINLDILRSGWLIGLLVVVLRGLTIWAGTTLGARVFAGPPVLARYAWLGFLTQAGVSLGLANEVARRFPDWGGVVATLLIAVISINQIIGPIAFKYALGKAGETK